MPNILEDAFRKVKKFIDDFFMKKPTEKETRSGELKRQEFFERDEFEQRNYEREEKRTGVITRAAEKPKRVW